jgi:sorting nexin-1/2
MFFETDQKMPKPPSSMFSTMAKSVATYFETDEFFEDRWRQMDVLSGQLNRLHRAVEGMVNVRKGLSVDTTNFAKTFAALADSEELKALTQAMHQLADVEAKVAKFHMKQSGRDFYDFSEWIRDYIALVASAKTALGQRQDVNRTFINAVASLDSKKKKLAAIEADPNKVIKVEPAKQEVKDAEQKVADSQAAVANISRLMRRELERFDHYKANDFIQMCVKYIESVMTMEHQIVKAWEAFLPEAKSIPI